MSSLRSPRPGRATLRGRWLPLVAVTSALVAGNLAVPGGASGAVPPARPHTTGGTGKPSPARPGTVMPGRAGQPAPPPATTLPALLTPTAADPCPWAQPAAQQRIPPAALADAVVAHMTLAEKAGFVVLHATSRYENVDTGVARLCLPRLVLSDGPNGIAYGTQGVTQLPASLGVAASFDTALAHGYGQVLGREARGLGIDVVQGPNLNLLRVPEDGRAYEGYGEDPYLVSQMGVADITGIQSQGVMADAKHFTAYNQETGRLLIDQEISARALAELYMVPFAAAVNQGHVASIMCAYGEVNGTNTCSDPTLYDTLMRTWSFTGFVRSDLQAVTDPAAAFTAGLSLIKPATPADVLDAVARGRLSLAALDDDIARVLAKMFAFGLIGNSAPTSATPAGPNSADALFALKAAEESAVLLKNAGVLPLARNRGPIAVIGADAAGAARTAGNGSARVVAPFLVTPLAAIQAGVSHGTTVTFASGGVPYGPLPQIPLSAYRSGAPLPGMVHALWRDPDEPNPAKHHEGGKSDIKISTLPAVTPAIATADTPLLNRPGWTSWTATVVAPRSGLYELSVGSSGDCWFSVDGKALLSSRGVRGFNTWDVATRLVAGRSYRLSLAWFQAGPLQPRIGWLDATPAIDRAVAAARSAKVAVVFARDFTSEAFDRPTLTLPGAQDQLIAAVARANPHTVVVLNTGGAVLMPWLDAVKAVVEAWYPGEQDGAAAAAVLFGSVDPGGRLPITFPASNGAVPTSKASQWPGVDGVVSYSEGLDIGYRWYEAHGVRPLFPFGYGLTYTHFRWGVPTLHTTETADAITVPVTNTGSRTGTDVVQCYLQYPAKAGEPPRQLRAFARVTLAPHRRATAHLTMGRSAFTAYIHGGPTVPTGRFIAWIGTSSSTFAYHLTVVPPRPAATSARASAR